jgi:6-phosphofructokinase 1
MIDGQFIEMNSRSVSNIIQRGGTILKTSRSEEFTTAEGRRKACEQLVKYGVEGIVCIGGDGTFNGAKIFYEEFGIPSMGAPGTIDNDLGGTDFTIGFDTAINTAVEAIDKIRDTADSHERVFFVEVMGRHSGAIALACGIAGGAEIILLPEAADDWTMLMDYFSAEKSQKAFSIIIVAEGDEEGGAYKIVERLKENLLKGFDARVSVLGHIQRGGAPTAFDRVLGTRLGNAAVEALLRGETNKMAGLVHNEVVCTPYADVLSQKKPLDRDLERLITILNV